eukprot:4148995-Prymnesium_polylepis.1
MSTATAARQLQVSRLYRYVLTPGRPSYSSSRRFNHKSKHSAIHTLQLREQNPLCSTSFRN